jgi:hypothetical protein
MSRERIFAEVNEERRAQETRWSAALDDANSPMGWIALIARHAGLAIDDGAIMNDPERFRRQMIRVAALAVAAIESRDRIEGRKHVAGDHTPGSGF